MQSIVAKRRSGRYVPGGRGWVKVKNREYWRDEIAALGTTGALPLAVAVEHRIARALVRAEDEVAAGEERSFALGQTATGQSLSNQRDRSLDCGGRSLRRRISVPDSVGLHQTSVAGLASRWTPGRETSGSCGAAVRETRMSAIHRL